MGFVHNDSRELLLLIAVGGATASARSIEERLQEPFVTVNTVSGDAGIKRAQDEYLRLMRNKTPKRRRN